MNKASGGDRIPVELFQILKDDAVKVRHSSASKFGKLSSGNRIGKGQISFQSQRKAMPKNVEITVQLRSFHILAILCSKSFKLGISSMRTKNFPQFIVIHTVKGFSIVNKAEIYVFLELSCFFNDPADVGNLSMILLVCEIEE